jgi:hypothetical protein
MGLGGLLPFSDSRRPNIFSIYKTIHSHLTTLNSECKTSFFSSLDGFDATITKNAKVGKPQKAVKFSLNVWVSIGSITSQ